MVIAAEFKRPQTPAEHKQLQTASENLFISQVWAPSLSARHKLNSRSYKIKFTDK